MTSIDWFDVTLVINLLDDINDVKTYLKPKGNLIT
jgi:hypothetical protein